MAVPPSKGSISGLQQPGQRRGQPWNHRAKRTPGPSASVCGTIWATDRTTSSRLLLLFGTATLPKDHSRHGGRKEEDDGLASEMVAQEGVSSPAGALAPDSEDSIRGYEECRPTDSGRQYAT